LGCAHPLAPRPLELSRERRWVYMIGGGSYPLWRVLALTHRWLSRQRLTEELTASYQRELEDRLAQEKSRRMQLQEELFLAQHMDSIGRLAGDFSGHLDRKRADRLGLTMVQGIASRESGEIAAANLDGIGSRFRVYLPAARGDDP
jgi:C4-dicarboxylate-specific signal transduction histidine kinase